MRYALIVLLLTAILWPAQTAIHSVNGGTNVAFIDIDGDGKLEMYTGDVRILHYKYRGIAYASESNIILNTSSGQYVVGLHSKPYAWDIYNYIIAAVNMSAYSQMQNDNWLVLYDFSGNVINYVYIGRSDAYNVIAVRDGAIFFNSTAVIGMDNTGRYGVYTSSAINMTRTVAWRDGYRIYFYEYDFPGVLYKKYYYWSSIYTVWSVSLMHVIMNASITATDVFGGMTAIWGKEVTGAYALMLLQDKTTIATLTFDEQIINVAFGDLGNGGSADAFILTVNHFYAYDKNKGIYINMTLPKPAEEGLAVVDADEDGEPELVYTATDNSIVYVDLEQGVANRFIDIPAYYVPQNYYRLYDYDHDSVGQSDEIVRYRTSIITPDTDGDCLSDYDEINKYCTDPASNDTDGDGLTDCKEIALDLNPLDPDTDGDGLLDGQELVFGSDPLKNDTDGDGLADLEEYNLGTSPTKTDTDGDGLTDYEEAKVYHTDPLNPDTDGDGFIDSKDPDPLKPSPLREEEHETTQSETVTAVIMFAQLLTSIVFAAKYGGRR